MNPDLEGPKAFRFPLEAGQTPAPQCFVRGLLEAASCMSPRCRADEPFSSTF